MSVSNRPPAMLQRTIATTSTRPAFIIEPGTPPAWLRDVARAKAINTDSRGPTRPSRPKPHRRVIVRRREAA